MMNDALRRAPFAVSHIVSLACMRAIAGVFVMDGHGVHCTVALLIIIKPNQCEGHHSLASKRLDKPLAKCDMSLRPISLQSSNSEDERFASLYISSPFAVVFVFNTARMNCTATLSDQHLSTSFSDLNLQEPNGFKRLEQCHPICPPHGVLAIITFGLERQVFIAAIVVSAMPSSFAKHTRRGIEMWVI